MEQTQPTASVPAGAPIGVVTSLIGEDEDQKRRIVWAIAGAVLVHVILFILNLSGLGLDLLIEEAEAPDLIAVNLQLPSTPEAGGGSNRPVSAPPEPVKVKLPFKSETVPTRIPVPDLPEEVPQDVELPSLETKDLTSLLNTGPALAPPGPGGTGGFNAGGRGGGLGPGEGPGVGPAGRGGYGRPQILNKPKPEWTEEARRNGIQGEVLLKAVFAADGKVKNIRVVRGLGYGLDEKAIEAAKLIRFIPARGPDGRPASVRATISVEFTLL